MNLYFLRKDSFFYENIFYGQMLSPEREKFVKEPFFDTRAVIPGCDSSKGFFSLLDIAPLQYE